MLEYNPQPFNRIEVYKEIVETIKTRRIMPTESYTEVPIVKNRIKKRKKYS